MLTTVSKHEILNKALDFIQPVLPNFVGRILQNADKIDWWKNLVLNKLQPIHTRDLPRSGSYDECINRMDILLCFRIIKENWYDIFKNYFKKRELSWVHELIDIRNDTAHWDNEKADNYTFELIEHALSVMKLFMLSVDLNASNQISAIISELENKYES